MPINVGGIKLYTAMELSKKFDTTPGTLRKYINQGRITGQKMGGVWYVSEEALKAFFNSPPKPKTRETAQGS